MNLPEGEVEFLEEEVKLLEDLRPGHQKRTRPAQLLSTLLGNLEEVWLKDVFLKEKPYVRAWWHLIPILVHSAWLAG